MRKKYYAQIYVEYDLEAETPEVEARDFARFIARDVSRQLGVSEAYLNDWGRDYDSECPVCGDNSCERS